MDVDTASARHTYAYQGQTYYFCAPGCRKAFESDPQKYLKGGPAGMGGHGDHGHGH